MALLFKSSPADVAVDLEAEQLKCSQLRDVLKNPERVEGAGKGRGVSKAQ